MATNLANPAITHVFVLMLENRSFDHMLGFSGISGEDAATGKPTTINGTNKSFLNTYQNIPYSAMTPADNIMAYDPGHEFQDVAEQLCGEGISYKGGSYPAIHNNGFVANYAGTKSPGEGGATKNFGDIMKCYASPSQLPVLTQLATTFAVCDNWFASLPGPTWPNRFFVHAATSGGLDHSPKTTELLKWSMISGFSFPGGSIYDQMNKYPGNNKGWRIYHGVNLPLVGAIAGVAALKGIQLSDTHSYENFASDIKGAYPWSYTFIEPNYGDIINNSYSGGQSQHPMDDVRRGEALIKSTYEAIRNSPLWLSSMLVITYDEHGGFCDHVAPPPAVAPGDTKPYDPFNDFGFDFKQYGVRVPAVIISPYTKKNIISHTLYDHASVPATLERMFGMPALTARDAAANDLTGLANLPKARTDAPVQLKTVTAPTADEVAAAKAIQKPPDETGTVEEGNLPGFLHIVMKSHMEKHEQSTRMQLMDTFNHQVKTKADARAYVESTLPGLLAE